MLLNIPEAILVLLATGVGIGDRTVVLTLCPADNVMVVVVTVIVVPSTMPCCGGWLVPELVSPDVAEGVTCTITTAVSGPTITVCTDVNTGI